LRLTPLRKNRTTHKTILPLDPPPGGSFFIQTSREQPENFPHRPENLPHRPENFPQGFLKTPVKTMGYPVCLGNYTFITDKSIGVFCAYAKKHLLTGGKLATLEEEKKGAPGEHPKRTFKPLAATP